MDKYTIFSILLVIYIIIITGCTIVQELLLRQQRKLNALVNKQNLILEEQNQMLKGMSKIEVDCRKCEICTGKSCKLYGSNADRAISLCAKNSFKNYKQRNK